jgi:prepilin-type processing-associated H-X9-DG protein
MRTFASHSKRSPDAGGSRAFSRIDLIVVLAGVFFLAALQLPAFGKVRHHTKVAQCVGNLRQLVLAFEIYANENRDQLPQTTVGSWAWDFPWALGTNMSRYGASKEAFYCPANLDNMDLLWNYAPPSFHVIGYATTLPGGAGLNVTNANSTLTPPAILVAFGIQTRQLASQRVLVADATVSQPGQNNEAQRLSYKYDTIAGGFSSAQRCTSHMDGSLPAGGNVGMVDGHVEWHRFADMHPRTDNGALPVFWW